MSRKNCNTCRFNDFENDSCDNPLYADSFYAESGDCEISQWLDSFSWHVVTRPDRSSFLRSPDDTPTPCPGWEDYEFVDTDLTVIYDSILDIVESEKSLDLIDRLNHAESTLYGIVHILTKRENIDIITSIRGLNILLIDAVKFLKERE